MLWFLHNPEKKTRVSLFLLLQTKVIFKQSKGISKLGRSTCRIACLHCEHQTLHYCALGYKLACRSNFIELVVEMRTMYV